MQKEVDRLIGVKEVSHLTTLSRTALWRLEKGGKFPDRVRVTERCVAWRLSDVLDWIETRQRVADDA